MTNHRAGIASKKEKFPINALAYVDQATQTFTALSLGEVAHTDIPTSVMFTDYFDIII